jgi:hypothetical protein
MVTNMTREKYLALPGTFRKIRGKTKSSIELKNFLKNLSRIDNSCEAWVGLIPYLNPTFGLSWLGD